MHKRSALKKLLLPAMAIVAVFATATPASATVIPTTATIIPGVSPNESKLVVGSKTFFLGEPACSTAAEDDGGTDGGSFAAGDPQCASALDANERLPGLQVYVAPKVAGSYDTATKSFTGVGLTFPSSETCISSTQCLTITISDLGGASGTLNTATGAGTFTFKVKVDIDAAVGFPGLGANCAINPVPSPSGLASVSTANYSNVSGAARYTGSGIAVPGSTGCGLLYGALIDSTLGVPGTASAVFNVVYSPVLP